MVKVNITYKLSRNCHVMTMEPCGSCLTSPVHQRKRESGDHHPAQAQHAAFRPTPPRNATKPNKNPGQQRTRKMISKTAHQQGPAMRDRPTPRATTTFPSPDAVRRREPPGESTRKHQKSKRKPTRSPGSPLYKTHLTRRSRPSSIRIPVTPPTQPKPEAARAPLTLAQPPIARKKRKMSYYGQQPPVGVPPQQGAAQALPAFDLSAALLP
jgi:hypothetical protein